jgi:hypothetical protein
MQSFIFVFYFDKPPDPQISAETDDVPTLEKKCWQILLREGVSEVLAWDRGLTRILVSYYKSKKQKSKKENEDK